jgi:hypothetical protein
MLPDTSKSRLGRRILKRFMYAQLAVLDGLMQLLGRSQPRIRFTIKADPPSVYYNFRIKAEQREEFERYANLPAGFEICPIRCLADDSADYLLTLNIYEVEGLASGRRAEWSTYILDDTNKPRYMVLEAASSTWSMDPVAIITPKGRVEHRLADGRVQSTVASLEDRLIRIEYSIPASAPPAALVPEWVAANDTIYWRNGICDRAFYDSAMAYPRALAVPLDTVAIDNQTHWAPFVEPRPKHVVQIQGAMDLVIQPWRNL